MKGNAEANMLWDGLMVAVRDILCLVIGFYLFYSLTTAGKLFP